MNELNVVSGPFSAAGAVTAEALSRMLRWRVTRGLSIALTHSASTDGLVSGWSFIEANWHFLDAGSLSALPAFGQFENCEDDASAVLRAALLLVTLGAEGECLVCDVPVQTVYLGIIPLSVQGTVAVKSGDGSCIVTVLGTGMLERVARYERIGNHWGQVARPPVVVTTGQVSVQVAYEGSPCAARDFLGDLDLAAGGEPDIRDTIGRALDLIQQNYPDGLSWIAPVLRGLALVHTAAGSSSGSSSSHPGLIFVSYPISVDHLAAQIVHECAHQYLAIHQAWSPLTDGNPKERYYSPFKQTSRPLYNVLLALHAAVNIRELTSSLKAGGVRTPYIVSEHEQLRLQILQMLGDVRAAPGLTAAGRALVGNLDQAFTNG